MQSETPIDVKVRVDAFLAPCMGDAPEAGALIILFSESKLELVALNMSDLDASALADLAAKVLHERLGTCRTTETLQ